jgi:hypothetical protein
MRFSIRDLLWLTAVVALAATIYSDRIRVARLQQKWAAEKALVQRETAAAVALMQAKVAEVRAQNLMQEHRFDMQLAAERLHHQRELDHLRIESARRDLRLQQSAAAAAHIELSAQQE